MDGPAAQIHRKETLPKDATTKEVETCGTLYRGGECNFSSCAYTTDHYHCQVCGSSTTEVSQALAHVRTSQACRKDLSSTQYPACAMTSMTTDAANSLYNAIYSGLSAQNPFPGSGFSGYSQMDSYQWHPSMPVDKVAICSSQLSPCCSTSGGSRIPVDGQLCSPISDLYNKVTAPAKDLVSLPAKSSGTAMDSQAWFSAYNSQQMQKPLYKYPDQTALPQMNFLLLDPSDQKHQEMNLLPAGDSNLNLPITYPMKSDYVKDLNGRDLLKDSYCSYASQSMPGMLSEDGLMSLQLTDENLKQADLYHSHQQSHIPQIRHEDQNTVGRKSLKEVNSSNSSRLLSRFSQEHYGNCMSSCNVYSPVLIPSKDQDRNDENSNQTSSSASDSDESDIIVEDTGDELGAEITESEISIEDIKCSLLQGVVNGEGSSHTAAKPNYSVKFTKVHETSKTDTEEREIEVVKDLEPVTQSNNTSCSSELRCVVCDMCVAEDNPGSFFIQINSQLPLTSSSHIPILSKLAQVIARNLADFLDAYGSFICRRCFNLVDTIDNLEIKLESAKHHLASVFKGSSKSAVTNDDQCAKLVVDLIEQSQQPLLQYSLTESFKPEKINASISSGVLVSQSNCLVNASCNTQPSSENQEIVNTNTLKMSDIQGGKETFSILPSTLVSSVEKSIDITSPLNNNSCQNEVQNNSRTTDILHEETQKGFTEGAKLSSVSLSVSVSEQLEQQIQLQVQKQPEQHRSAQEVEANSLHLMQKSTLVPHGVGQSLFPLGNLEMQHSSKTTQKNNVRSIHDQQSKNEAASKESSNSFCDQCGKCIVTFAGLEGHQCVMNKVNLLCDICGKSFQKQNQLDDHISWHGKPTQKQCGFCGKCFATASLLVVHMRTHTGEKPFSCKNCKRGFAHRSNLVAHQNICSGSSPFKCDKCDQSFALHSVLKRHVKSVHEGEPSVVKCAECGKGFMKPSDLHAHQRVHSSERAFTCKICNRQYKSIGNLNHHAKSHLSVKPFTCNICGEGFLRKEMLDGHINNHKGEKPFKCSRCPKSFWNKSNLAVHNKWHEGAVKKNTCQICHKTFTQKLSVHMRTHTGEKPFHCNVCSQNFTTQSSLKKHSLSKHQLHPSVMQSSELEPLSRPPSC